MSKVGALKYELLLLLMSAIWGSTFVAQQIGMQKGLGPMTYNALRFALGCLSLIPVMIWRSKAPGARGGLPLVGSLAAGGFLFVAASLQQVGLQYTSSANSGFITAFYILFVPLIGLFLGQRVGRSLWSGIAICLVGLYLLSVSGQFTVSKGDWLTLAGAVMWAGQILVIDRISTDGDPIRIAAAQFAVCAGLSALYALFFEHCTMEHVRVASGAVAYAGVLSVGVAFTLQVVCQKRCAPGSAAVIMSTESVFAALAGYVVLHQTLTTRAIAGCGLILLGVLIVQIVPMWRRQEQAG